MPSFVKEAQCSIKTQQKLFSEKLFKNKKPVGKCVSRSTETYVTILLVQTWLCSDTQSDTPVSFFYSKQIYL